MGRKTDELRPFNMDANIYLYCVGVYGILLDASTRNFHRVKWLTSSKDSQPYRYDLPVQSRY